MSNRTGKASCLKYYGQII